VNVWFLLCLPVSGETAARGEPGRSLDPMQRYFRHCPAAEAGINFGFSYRAKDGFAKCGKVIAASYLVRLHA